jgi:hypothetical protein
VTAEIAIMNRSAVALAADSAVTISGPNGNKIFDTANKLFALSKHHPVGLLIYGGADLLDVPWEVIVKEFRAELGKEAFRTLPEYGQALVKYLTGNARYFPQAQELKCARSRVGMVMAHLAQTTDAGVRKRFEAGDNVDNDDILAIMTDATAEVTDWLSKQPAFDGTPNNFGASLLEEFSDELDALFDELLGSYPVSDDLREAIRAVERLSLERSLGQASGVVVAGYGEDDFMPHLVEYSFEGVLGGHPLYVHGNDIQITFDNHASIVPLAQREMVDLFMEGIEPGYRLFLDDVFRGALSAVVEAVLDRVGNAAVTAEDLQDEVDKLAAALSTEAERYRGQVYVRPIIDSVAYLPIDKLAEMAESLVNLTSFKRRVAMGQTETVGGAVDVAVISKGDGLIWINRKHYFRPELNQHFFATYYDDTDG